MQTITMEETIAVDCLLGFAGDLLPRRPPLLPSFSSHFSDENVSTNYNCSTVYSFNQELSHKDFPDKFEFNNMNFDNAKDLPEGIEVADDVEYNFRARQLHHDDPNFPAQPPDLLVWKMNKAQQKLFLPVVVSFQFVPCH